MSRWDNEGVAYKRTQNWTALPHGDEFISVVNNFGPMIVKLNYYDEVISFLKVSNEKGEYREVGYFPIEELEEIVGHMKNTMKRRRKQFEESIK